jgi:hypothetical protein
MSKKENLTGELDLYFEYLDPSAHELYTLKGAETYEPPVIDGELRYTGQICIAVSFPAESLSWLLEAINRQMEDE